MAKKDEISSTEKLLGLIRQKNDEEQTSSDLSNTEDPNETQDSLKETRQDLLSKVVPLRKKATVGVDIGYYELKLGMINQVSEKKQALLEAYRRPELADSIRSDMQKYLIHAGFDTALPVTA